MNQSIKLTQKYKQRATTFDIVKLEEDIGKLPFLKGNKNYFAFDGSKNIFADFKAMYWINYMYVD